MSKIIVLLLLIAFGLWLWKTRRWTDALFGLTVVAGVFTWGSGYELLKSSKSSHWHGVTLIAVGLVVMMGLSIFARVHSSQKPSSTRDDSPPQ